jgi:hypothetical protein
MDYVAYRHLVGVCYTEEEAKALAEEVWGWEIRTQGLGLPLWWNCKVVMGLLVAGGGPGWPQ